MNLDVLNYRRSRNTCLYINKVMYTLNEASQSSTCVKSLEKDSFE
jgi:hypothetical protein